jgi:hypothetical protein
MLGGAPWPDLDVLTGVAIGPKIKGAGVAETRHPSAPNPPGGRGGWAQAGWTVTASWEETPGRLDGHRELGRRPQTGWTVTATLAVTSGCSSTTTV